jgi:type VI secretion system secreted protein Hcp
MSNVDYFLKIDDIPGESKDANGCADHIEVLTWSWGETNSGTAGKGTGMGAGKVNMQDFHFTMTMNKATPKLMIACAKGTHIKKGLLTCRRAGDTPQTYLTITFTDLMVSSYQVGGSSSDNIPIDQCSFNYSKVEWEYKPQGQDGKVAAGIKGGYDVKLNQHV